MKSSHLVTLCASLGLMVLSSSSSFSQLVTTNASDNAGNYAGNWGDGSNGGTGFQAWSFSSGSGTGGAGRFIGNPASLGITGMSGDSFALYANPAGSGAFIDAVRVFPIPFRLARRCNSNGRFFGIPKVETRDSAYLLDPRRFLTSTMAQLRILPSTAAM